MKCSDVERILPEAVDGAEDYDLQAHLKSCPACSELVSDLKAIASEASFLAEADEPAPRVWVNIANQLRAEGLIRDPEPAPIRTAISPARPSWWKAWWLAPVAAAIIAVGAYEVGHRTAQPSAEPVAHIPAQSISKPSAQEQPSQTARVEAPAKAPADRKTAPMPSVRSGSPVTDSVDEAEVSPPAGSEDDQFLSEVSQRAPGMRATYENQLKAVNAEIRDTQEYLRLHPGDFEARQHLMEVYQQKAMLYQMAIDRVQ